MSLFHIDAPHPAPFVPTDRFDFIGSALAARFRRDTPPMRFTWHGDTVSIPWQALDDQLRIVTELVEAILDRRPWTTAFFAHSWQAELRLAPRGASVEMGWTWTVPRLPDRDPIEIDRSALLAQWRPVLQGAVDAVDAYTADPRLAVTRSVVERLDRDQGA